MSSVGKPFAAGFDARRNAGGRPRGLAAAARAAVGEDGHALIEFFTAVMRADREYLGEKVTLQHRLEAAKWLADRAWGKPPQTVAIADIEREQQTATVQALFADFTQEEKSTIRAILLARRQRYLAAECEKAEAKMRSYLPSQQPDGNGEPPPE